MGTTLRQIVSPAFGSMTLPRTIGKDFDHSLMHRHRNSWMAPETSVSHIRVRTHSDVLVLARGLAIDSNGEALPETTHGFSKDDLEQATSRASEYRASAKRVDGSHLLVVKPGLGTYGHALVEILPHAWVVGTNAYKPIIGAVKSPIRAVYHEVLRRLGYADWVESNGPLLVEELVTVDGFARTAEYISPLFQDFVQAIAPGRESGRRRLYLPRSKGLGRNVVNENEVECVLNLFGFETVRPENLSFSEQVSLFRDASHVVGVMGSAFSNLAFCGRGTKALTLAPEMMTDNFFWKLASFSGVAYSDLRCPTRENSISQASGRLLDRSVEVRLSTLVEWLEEATP